MNNNENVNGKQVLSHKQFFLAAEALKKNKQQFLDLRPGSVEAAKILTELVGFKISRSTISNLKDSTGVNWESRKSPSTIQSLRGNSIRTLTNSLHRLYSKLGEEIPQALEELKASFQKANDKERNNHA